MKTNLKPKQTSQFLRLKEGLHKSFTEAQRGLPWSAPPRVFSPRLWGGHTSDFVKHCRVFPLQHAQEDTAGMAAGMGRGRRGRKSPAHLLTGKSGPESRTGPVTASARLTGPDDGGPEAGGSWVSHSARARAPESRAEPRGLRTHSLPSLKVKKREPELVWLRGYSVGL